HLPRLPRLLDAALHLPARALGGAAADRETRGVQARVAHLRLALADVAEGLRDRGPRVAVPGRQALGDATQPLPDPVNGAVAAQQLAAILELPVLGIARRLALVHDRVEVAHEVLEIDELA